MATKKTVKKATSTQKTVDELKADLLVAQNDLVEARRSHASRELANTTRLRDLRVQIAQIKTTLVQIAKSEEKA